MLSEIIRTNARGQSTDELRNNGAFVIANSYYGWDSLGNLKFRSNKSANVGVSINNNISDDDGKLTEKWSAVSEKRECHSILI